MLLPSGNGVEEGDGSAIRDESIRRDEPVVEQQPERRRRQAVGLQEIPGEPRVSADKPGEQVPQRAREADKLEIEGWPAQNHSRRAGQEHVDSHGRQCVRYTSLYWRRTSLPSPSSSSRDSGARMVS